MNEHILARLPKRYTHAQLIEKSKQLNAAELQKPVLPHPPRPAKCNGALVFPLESGGRWCMNCGGDHE